MSFNTALNIIFSVKKYAQELLKIVDKRDIQVPVDITLCELCDGRVYMVLCSCN